MGTRRLPAACVTGVLIFSISLATIGCGIGLHTAPTEFTIAVDSIVAPAAIAPGTPLTVRFLGHIGPDQCSRLAQVDAERGPGSLDIAFRGQRVHDGYCPQMPAVLDHSETIAPPLQDPFTIRVTQPDGTHLEQVVRIQAPALQVP